MRLLFLLTLIAGVGLGVVYPWWAETFSGHHVGAWRIFDHAAGYRTVEVRLAAEEAPLRVLLDLRVVGQLTGYGPHGGLILTAASGERTAFSRPLRLNDARLTARSAAINERIYRDNAGVISEVADGKYIFTLQPRDDESIYIRSIDLVLRADIWQVSQGLRVLGLLMMAVGQVGLVAAIHRRRLAGEAGPRTVRQGQDDENPA
ncbi:hypothetical protein [Mesorhizobium sp. KR2-14]|uniref:hypothetical protein n=1 Tax=Mesorhizobium sp. KR2-14 TaxID=3156610 RepID=UPI0032B60313